MVIAKTAVAVSAVADEDADAADVAVVDEAKVAPRADHPWVAQKEVGGQRTRSLPRPHRCRRLTVVTIIRTVVHERARASSRALLRNTASLAMSRSSRATHAKLVRHSRTTGLRSLNSGTHLHRRDM